MKFDVVLAGVGGQGVLSIAAIIGLAAVDGGLRLKQAEVHGMSQRGGSVQSHLRIADHPIFSDLIPEGGADLLLSMEPMETLRYVPFLAKDGAIVAERSPVVNITNYPALDEVLTVLQQYPRITLIDAEVIARDMRASRSSNMVLLGAASVHIPLMSQDLEAAISEVFSRKGDNVVAQNIEAFRKGREMVNATPATS